MPIMLRRLWSALIIFALLGGTTVQALPVINLAQSGASGAPAATAAGVPCAQMTSMPQKASPVAPLEAPCKGLTSDCIKKMNCVSLPALTDRPVVSFEAVAYTKIFYGFASTNVDGMSPEPPLFPPIG